MAASQLGATVFS